METSYDACLWYFPWMQGALGGGVWRLQWHAHYEDQLLGACMHKGCSIVKIDAAGGTATVLETYEGHESVVYGADWCRQPLHRPLIATCSFYDRELHLWESDTIH